MNTDWTIAGGAFSLGVLIGALVAWYISDADMGDRRVLFSAISALVGSSVLAMFSFLAGLHGPTSEYWFYPIGLLAGFSAIMGFEIWYWGYDGEGRNHRPINKKGR